MRHVLVLTRDIEAPPAAVWAVITDIDGRARTLRGIERIERIPGPEVHVVDGYAVGTAWRETRRMLGQSASEDMTVTRVDEPRSTTIEAVAGETRYITAFHLDERVGGGTTLTFEFSAKAPRRGAATQLALDLVGAVGFAVTRRVMQRDLADIARAAEARAAKGAS